MNAKLAEWLRLVFALVSTAVATFALSLLMNLTGDCELEVHSCGEPARQLTFLVLGFGVVLITFFVVRFVRNHRR